MNFVKTILLLVYQQQQELVSGSTEWNHASAAVRILQQELEYCVFMQYLAPPIVRMLYVSWSTVAISTIRNQAPPFPYGYNNSLSLDFAKTLRKLCSSRFNDVKTSALAFCTVEYVLLLSSC